MSPHLDDAVFSSAAALSVGPSIVWTVFAGHPEPVLSTSWDRSCGFSDSGETMSARIAEDRAAFAGTQAKLRHLPYLDGPYTDPTRRRADLADFAHELTTWLDDHPDATVVAPAGAGARVKEAIWERLRAPRTTAPPGPAAKDSAGVPAPPTKHPQNPLTALARHLMHAHYRRRRAKAQRKGLAVNPDHLAVRDVALDVALGRASVILYEDLPYLWAEPADAEVACLIRSRGLTAQLVELDVDVDAKFNRCQSYASQLELMDPSGRLSTPGHLPRTERYWHLTRNDAA